ncbi:methyltransferase domain-containing protein [Fulvivirga sp. M361]|uniref:class I SAM-dependent methyltransferase n=1 Tax=Fulvivirga sp. M361 TaxID=2594266 RepID=UPI001179E82C|nr:methyltransferase domain-containing protein [Fulvivirga sp. M361]TRX60129.1 methyltransferase domain-containing protein [Fulvivirga sp. M361]
MKTETPNFTRYTRIVDIKRLKFITENLKWIQPENAKILDVGCGNGNMSIQLGMLGYNVLGVDISEKAIKKAKETNTQPNVDFKVISAEDLVAEGTKYDAIICSEVLEHLDNPSALLHTINEILKDNGSLVVTVPNGNGPRETLMTKPMQWMQRNDNWLWKFTKSFKRALGYDGKTIQSDADDLEHVQFFTKAQLTDLSKNTKFRIEVFENADFLEDVFPVSLLTKKIVFLQRLDCKIADLLPHQLTGGFHTIWKKAS